MRTTVALVEAHPETIAQDYRRALQLAGVISSAKDQSPAIIMATDSAGFRPGWGATPWQLDAVLGCLGERSVGARVCALAHGGLREVPAVALWQDCLTRHRAVTAGPEFLRLHSHSSALLHPALDTVLPNGVRAPLGLANGPVLLLTAPAVIPEWGVGGASVALQSIVGAGGRMPVKRKAPSAEIVAEAVGVSRELMPDFGVVLDGTLWGVENRSGRRSCVARNVILAGTDPVAVDAVAMRLVGMDPLRASWLRLCHERGFGRIMPADVQIVGRTDLPDLDFALQGDTFTAGRSGAWSTWGRQAGRWWDRVRNQPLTASLVGTAWERLNDEYTAGREPLAATAGMSSEVKRMGHG